MATEKERNVELAVGGLRDWIAGDRAAVMETFSRDLEVFVPSELGNAGTFHGLDEFLNWVAAWEEAWSDYRMEIGEYEASGERHVLVEVRSTGKGAGSGIEVGNVLIWVMGVGDDAKLEYLALQADLERARELAAARESAD